MGTWVLLGGEERITEYTAEYCPVDQVEDMLLGRGARPDMDVFALGATIYRLINGTSLNPPEVVRKWTEL